MLGCSRQYALRRPGAIQPDIARDLAEHDPVIWRASALAVREQKRKRLARGRLCRCRKPCRVRRNT